MSTRIHATVDPTRSRIDARTEGDQPIAMDVDPPLGDDSAPGPKETLLAALAGCTAVDVASIMRKKRQSMATYEIEATGESASEHPKVFTSIVVEHVVSGDVAPEALRRSIELSATQYCPVNAMLARAVRIEHRYRLIDGSGTRHEALVAVTGPDRPLGVDGT